MINLNELEFVKGEIFANVLPSNRIARIDPQTGKINGWINMNGLYQSIDYDYPADALNGIAYDKENDRLFITGKLWPKLFEVRIIPKSKE